MDRPQFRGAKNLQWTDCNGPTTQSITGFFGLEKMHHSNIQLNEGSIPITPVRLTVTMEKKQPFESFEHVSPI